MRIKFSEASEKFDATLEHFKQELAAIRAGRANPSLVDNIEVSVYGSSMPINQLAGVNVVDSSLLTVRPWDKSNIDDISKAIEVSDIGINPIIDGEVIKLPIPSLTEERRKEYVKLMGQKVEEARIAVRQIRKDILVGMDQQKDDGDISEDVYNRQEKQLQELVEKANDKIAEMADNKEEELMKV